MSKPVEMGKSGAQNQALHSLSDEIIRIRGKQNLLDIILHKLKEHLQFDDSFILQYDKEKRTCKPYIYFSKEVRASNPQYKIYIHRNFPITDDVVLDVNYPIVYEVQELLHLGLEGLEFMHQSGIKSFVVTKLVEGGKLIGLFVLLSERKNNFKTADLDLLHSLSYQISIATANIIANEEIAKREEEKTTLLSLSHYIATVRNRNELQVLLNKKLPALFPIIGFGITLLNKSGNSHSPFIVDVDPELKNVDFKAALDLKYDVNDGIFNLLFAAEQPRELEVDKLPEMNETPAYVKYWKNMNFKRVIGMPVQVGRKKLGCFMLIYNPNYEGNMSNLLFQGVGAQISVAISNIIGNEEILEKEKEKTILLSLSNEIASLKDRNDLNRVVNRKIKKLFAIKQFGIAQINENRETHSVFMLDVGHSDYNHIDYLEVISTKYSITDPVFGQSMASEDSITFDVSKLAEQPDAPAYIHFLKAVGFQDLLCLALRVGGTNIGCIFFNIEPNEINNLKIYLLKSVCAQLSVAVSNILANERIKRAEEEKSLLLSFSNDIATVRSKEGLRQIVKQYLKNIFHIKEYIITTRNIDGNTYSYFLHDSQANDPDDEGWKIMLGNHIPVKGAFIGAVLQAEEAVFDVDELLKQRKFYFPAAAFWKAAGAKKVMGFRLIVADKDIGLLVIQPGQIHTQLLKGISAQLAIAIANISAIEEIVGREKEKSMLLEFSNAIASVRDNASLSTILNREMKQLFGINEYAIHVLSEDNKTHRPIFFDAEAAFAKHPVFIKLINQPTEVNDGIFNTILASDEPITFNVEEWITLNKPPMYAGAAKDIGLKQITGVRIQLGGQNIAVLNFRHDDVNITPAQYPLLKSICSQIAIAIANISANEKVLQQLAEINSYKQQLEQEKVYLKEEIETAQNFSELVGESGELKKIFALISKVAASDSTILLLGETGTGKELVARAIHNASARKNKLMVKVNCAALPANLIESELFGHERGSFTGAFERRIGKFELANGGTLFLDEIGEMPLELQVKLLRVLQEREIERLGGKATINVDVRIIAATNRDLEKLTEEGRFRRDLFYRLNVFPIHLPALRDRQEDILPLATYFIQRFVKKTGKKISGISKKAAEDLVRYQWPGNVRELEHLIERSVLLSSSEMLNEIHLPSQQKGGHQLSSAGKISLSTIDDNERHHILNTLKFTNGRIAGEGGAAELLGVPPSTLNSKMKRLGIRKEHLDKSGQ